ncbi:precorrin-2 C(20)-methyltransferase [Laceyella putida]|uniref:Precorrin-2 C(20)-methyltransferase n=1 Tax=Laceyella putida TaxID=110101 RepID=A0ABW2RHM9_9BACL
MSRSARYGKLIGIGVGPGDPELLTVKAYRLLKETPVIAYPKKRMGEKSYALAIVEQYVHAHEKEMVGLIFPMTRDPEVLGREWDRTVETVWSHLSQGKDVAFVTEGDPMLYSTFIHLGRRMRELHPQVELLSVPGISSVNGAASRLHTPLADGDEQVVIVPATDDREAMRRALQTHVAVVFLKVAKVLDLLIDVLTELELLDCAVVVSKVTSPEEQVWWDVRELKGRKLGYLSLMVVRK